MYNLLFCLLNVELDVVIRTLQIKCDGTVTRPTMTPTVIYRKCLQETIEDATLWSSGVGDDG